MINPSNIYHTGYAVSDLHAAQRFYSDSLGYNFAPVHLYDPLRLWVPDKGWTEEWLSVTYSREGPHHLELIEGRKGGFYDPAVTRNTTHLGMWADDIPGDVAHMTAHGWEVIGARDTPEEGYGDMCYLYHAYSGAMIELVSVRSKARITAWFTEGL